MDPNANLRQQREIVRIHNTLEGSDIQLSPRIMDRLVELVEALDEWLTKGGFMPDAWKRGPEDAHDIERRLADARKPYADKVMELEEKLRKLRYTDDDPRRDRH